MTYFSENNDYDCWFYLIEFVKEFDQKIRKIRTYLRINIKYKDKNISLKNIAVGKIYITLCTFVISCGI